MSDASANGFEESAYMRIKADINAHSLEENPN